MTIRLKRSIDMSTIINTLDLELLDHPEYKYLFVGDWHDLSEELKSIGWTEDAFLIMLKHDEEEVCIGYVKWRCNRTHDEVSNVSMLLSPEYLNSGIGAYVMARLLFYLLEDRGYRKIRFLCFSNNARGLRLYRKFLEFGGREVGLYKEDFKLRDGKYYDNIAFELLKKDFQSTSKLTRLASRVVI